MSTNGSQRRWQSVRRYLNTSRAALARTAAGLHGDWPCDDAGLVVPDGWLPEQPVPLREVRLRWSPEPAPPRVTGHEPQSFLVRPLRADGQRYPDYSAALAEIEPPEVFADRACYRLLEVAGGGTELTFGPASYFQGIDVAEAIAHELATICMATADRGGRSHLSRTDLPLRALVGDPADLAGRAVLPAVCALTIRHDRSSGEATFLLHERDPAKVASGGGLHQVAPVGIFQPASTKPADPGAEPADGDPDFDLWRCLAREYSEELLGDAEHTDVDYQAWPFWQRLERARERGDCRAWYLGAAADPLTFVVDLLTVVVFEAATFDELFADAVAGNAEGRVLSGLAFGDQAAAPYAESMQPAGAALLESAWRHREQLLG